MRQLFSSSYFWSNQEELLENTWELPFRQNMLRRDSDLAPHKTPLVSDVSVSPSDPAKRWKHLVLLLNIRQVKAGETASRTSSWYTVVRRFIGTQDWCIILRNVTHWLVHFSRRQWFTIIVPTGPKWLYYKNLYHCNSMQKSTDLILWLSCNCLKLLLEDF